VRGTGGRLHSDRRDLPIEPSRKRVKKKRDYLKERVWRGIRPDMLTDGKTGSFRRTKEWRAEMGKEKRVHRGLWAVQRGGAGAS